MSAADDTSILHGSRSPKRRRVNDDNPQEEQSREGRPSYNLPVEYEREHGKGRDNESREFTSTSLSAPPSSHTHFHRGLQLTGDGDEAECCYGMLSGIPVLPQRASNGMSSNYLPVEHQPPNILSARNDNSTTFSLVCPTASRVIRELAELEDIKVQLWCCSRVEIQALPKGNRKRKAKAKSSQSWFVNVIIYGTTSLQDIVGSFLSRHKMYLQDPAYCERRVLYRNPHMTSPEDGAVVMTESFHSQLVDVEVEVFDIGPDLLAQLMADQAPLPETEAPTIVKTALFSHQKQALTFMLRREQGWDLKTDGGAIWTITKGRHDLTEYRNNVNGHSQSEPPPPCHGGLLADDMGLGKTLSMICLIATNQPSNPPVSFEAQNYLYPACRATLLIVPPPLIQAWETQFHLHLQPDTLKVVTYHGTSKADIESLKTCDVVITTFQTLSSIWRKHNDNEDSTPSIYSFKWHRVILDEAHTIQNVRSQIAQACCALKSSRKWAITGTPIQNKLADFASILRFLEVHPYSDQAVFDEDISHPWRQGDPQAVLRLKTLVRAITISRTKDVIDLRPRVDEVHHLNFSVAERDVYDAARRESVQMLEDTISSGREDGRTFNALQRLNILRLICNHGLLVSTSTTKSSRPSSNFQAGMDQKSPPFYGNVLRGGAACFQCGADLFEDFLEYLPSEDFGSQSYVNMTDARICDRCILNSKCDNSAEAPGNDWIQLNGDEFSDSTVTPGSSTPMEIDSSPLPLPLIDSMSTKIKALIADLLKHYDSEKSVVFSYWTRTLDLVQVMLDISRISYTRIDGDVPLRNRTKALRRFQSEDSLRVILVSITCGGAGLDLTAASRAYLLEPHWNPMIEEQALCRVHRVGQLRDVTTIRYLIRDSFEEQVVEIQRKKRMLAKVTFGQDPLSESGVGLGTLMYLKSVLE